jgi:hypothetical protein
MVEAAPRRFQLFMTSVLIQDKHLEIEMKLTTCPRDILSKPLAELSLKRC